MDAFSLNMLAVAGAVACAAVGGELFMKSILATAQGLRLPKLLVATTLAAFATSSPELTVSVVAALSGAPEIGLGDALGSNVVNIALIFGLALLFGPVHARREDLGRDFVIALAVPVLTFLLAIDGELSRGEGMALLGLFGVWVVALLRQSRDLRDATQRSPADQTYAPLRILLFGAGGLALLIAAGRLFVMGAGGIAATFGIDTFVIGATVVAFGTSLPELVTVLLARLRGHDDVGVGTLIGSNLFNGLAIVGAAAAIHPISLRPGEVALALGTGMFALLWLLPARHGRIPAWRSLVLLGAYAGFVMLSIPGGSPR